MPTRPPAGSPPANLETAASRSASGRTFDALIAVMGLCQMAMASIGTVPRAACRFGSWLRTPNQRPTSETGTGTRRPAAAPTDPCHFQKSARACLLIADAVVDDDRGQGDAAEVGQCVLDAPMDVKRLIELWVQLWCW